MEFSEWMQDPGCMMQDRAGGEARVLSRSLHLYLKSGQSNSILLYYDIADNPPLGGMGCPL